MRLGMRSFLAHPGGAAVVGEAESSEQAVRLAADLHPDFVVIDPEFESGSFDTRVCREIKALPESPCVIVYTMLETGAVMAALALAGVDGYVFKGASSEELLETKERLSSGRTHVWVPRQRVMVSELRARIADGKDRFTNRGHQILALLLENRYTNEELARRLHLSEQTIKNHTVSIYRKLGVKGRKEFYALLDRWDTS
jgi:two-component system nitrate/nitrite response regulator NarL